MDIEFNLTDSTGTDGTDSTTDEAECCEEINSLELQKQELLEKLMTEFYSFFPPDWAKLTESPSSVANQCPQASNSVDTSKKAPGSSSSKSTASAGASGRKRQLNRKDSPGEDDEEYDKKRPKLGPVPTNVKEPSQMFACPFYKRDPMQYCRIGSCTGPGFPSVSRVKYGLDIFCDVGLFDY